MILTTVKVPEDYWESTSTNNEEFEFIYNEKHRKTLGIFYATIIALVFIGTHYMAANYVEEPAGFYPPYIEKSVVYPELYKNE